MADEERDGLRTPAGRERALDDHEGRLAGLEKREEARDVKVAAFKAAVDRNSALVAALILAIVSAALAVGFGVGH